MPKPVIPPGLVDFIILAKLVTKKAAAGRRRGQRVIVLPLSGKTIASILSHSTHVVTIALKEVFRQLSDDLYKVGMFDVLKFENAELASRVEKLISALGGSLARFRRSARYLMLEAHHVFPKGLVNIEPGKRHFPLILGYFSRHGRHPAINLPPLEHRGGKKILKALGPAIGDADLGFIKIGPGQSAESVTTELNRILFKHRALTPLTADADAERAATRALVNEIKEMYDTKFPGLLKKKDRFGFSLEYWFEEIHRHIDTAPHP